MKTLTCGFIGMGLIGGSIAKALKAACPAVHIIAYDTNAETLSLALAEQIADVAVPVIDSHFSDCDFLFLCAPVSHNDENLAAVKKIISPSCILTDVGSVKTTIHKHVEQAGLSRYFIGGHPMAGSERTGYQNSKALLLQNAYYILTPSKDSSPQMLVSYQELVKKIGALPLVLDYKQHDFVTAGISHLPHVIAYSLVNLVKDNDSKDGIMKMIAAGGFKDITRIASSSPLMWQQICMTNKENISELLSKYITALTHTKELVDTKNADALYTLFESARAYRESFADASSGPIKRTFAMTVSIADHPGSLSAIVSLLAGENISIKNIGITHNREAAEGAMHIEFYDEDAMKNAENLLIQNNYEIKIRTL